MSDDPAPSRDPAPRRAAGAEGVLPADLLERPAEEGARRLVRARALRLGDLARDATRGSVPPEAAGREVEELRALLRLLRPHLRGAVPAADRRALGRLGERLGTGPEGVAPATRPGHAARRELAALRRLGRRLGRRLSRLHIHRHLDDPDPPAFGDALAAALERLADELGELAEEAPPHARRLPELLRELSGVGAALADRVAGAAALSEEARAALRGLGTAAAVAAPLSPEGGRPFGTDPRVLTALAARARAVGGSLRPPAPPREVERKFLCRALPELPPEAEVFEVEQGWLPGDTFRERLRRVRGPGGEHFVRTLKLGTGAVRVEFEEEIDARLFAALWPLTEAARVRKRRYRIPAGARVVEVDEFLDRQLVLAEVELSRPDEPVELPAWLARVVVREVTDEAGFTNLELARPARRGSG